MTRPSRESTPRGSGCACSPTVVCQNSEDGINFEVDDIEAVVASMRRTGINFRNDIICGPGGKLILAADVVRYSRLMHADEEVRSGA